MNAEGLALLKNFEGFRGNPYKDAAGYPTIGYGMRLPITEPEAAVLMLLRLAPYEKAVEDAVTVPLTDNQKAALTSFVYNIGIGAFKKSTLLKKLNAGNYEAVPSELGRWVYAKGKKLTGLVRRRAAEAALWNT